jgi:GGDEF domain-containing protein
VGAVATRLGIDSRHREELVFGSLLHDVGKIGISERILLKPAKLTEEERRVVELHPRIGSRLVENVPALQPTARAILHHHERFDGDGYPQGLSGDEIPLESRIICVADAFSAMTADRPYRGRMSIEQACKELERCAGTQFDPEVVEAFIEEVRREPPPDDPNVLEATLRDPELDAERRDDEPVLGLGSVEMTDNLTLFHTHRHFHEMVERAAGREEAFSVVIAELLELTQLNQVEGYDAGDAAIKSVARTVENVALRFGASCARYSGRRLAVMIPGGDPDAPAEFVSATSDALATGPRVALGCAEWRPGDSGFDVIARARLALRPAIPTG